MSNAWFRLYHEFATDPKVQMLSEADQRRYVMLLCLRCSNGNETLHDDEIAFQLRISDDEWNSTKQRLLQRGLIDDVCNPCGWDKRQFSSDSSTARVSEHRARKKQACNVTETPPDTDTDTDTDTEKDNTYPLSRFSALVFLKQAGASETLARDWLKVRRAKRLAGTETAMADFLAEAAKTKLSLDDILRTCCTKGWGGFEAKWLANAKHQKDAPVDYFAGAI